MFVKKPWLRYFNEPEGGAGGAAGGSGGAAGEGGGSGDPAGSQNKGGDPDDEPLGEGGKKALETERTERKAAQQRVADLERQLQERDDAQLTDEQRRQRDADQHLTENGQIKEQNGTLAQENLRLRAALDAGLPTAWADRVRGATPEEMAADAASIKASLKSANDDDHTAGVGAGGSDAIETSPGMGTLRHAYDQAARTK